MPLTTTGRSRYSVPGYKSVFQSANAVKRLAVETAEESTNKKSPDKHSKVKVWAKVKKSPARENEMKKLAGRSLVYKKLLAGEHPARELHPVIHLQPFEHLGKVSTHGVLGDFKLLGDLLVLQSFGYQ